MADTAFNIIDGDALFGKSIDYINRALHMKRMGNLDEYQLWASLALELLGKAALARKHPCLVVDTKHRLSLFLAVGIEVTTDVKTINAMTLFKSLGTLYPRFDRDVQEFCQQLAERRNAELHSGDKPFKTMPLDKWESPYWYACWTILDHMESSLDEWLGANDAADSRQLLEAASMARKEDVNVRINRARKEFMKQNKSVRERLAKESVKWEPKHISDRFRGKYDKHWKMNCPACECFAIMAGDQYREIISEEREDSGIWETVDHQFIGEEFHCPTCELTLLGNIEIKAAQLVDGYWEQDDRDITRARDYGSD